MDKVIIGVDPHKFSVTIEARDNREILRATGQFRTDTRSYHQLLKRTTLAPAAWKTASNAAVRLASGSCRDELHSHSCIFQVHGRFLACWTSHD
jgi:hypothetical protein